MALNAVQKKSYEKSRIRTEQMQLIYAAKKQEKNVLGANTLS